MRDSSSGRSRGFGFLTFKDPKTVNIVMVKEHFLDGKIVSLLPCSDGIFMFENLSLTWTSRSTPSELFLVTNKKRRARFSSVESVRILQTRNSESTLPSLAE